jgi:hypothetical protein
VRISCEAWWPGGNCSEANNRSPGHPPESEDIGLRSNRRQLRVHIKIRLGWLILNFVERVNCSLLFVNSPSRAYALVTARWLLIRPLNTLDGRKLPRDTAVQAADGNQCRKCNRHESPSREAAVHGRQYGGNLATASAGASGCSKARRCVPKQGVGQGWRILANRRSNQRSRFW